MRDVASRSFEEAAAVPGGDDDKQLDSTMRSEVNLATGLLIVQLNIAAPAAFIRLRTHGYAADRSATAVAHDIVERRLRLDPPCRRPQTCTTVPFLLLPLR
jgi:AmiR/NasT family two-component response regulator